MTEKIALYYRNKYPIVWDYVLAIDSCVNRGWISDGLRIGKLDEVITEQQKNAAFTIYQKKLFS